MKKIALLTVLVFLLTAGSAFAADTINLDVKKAVELTLQNNPQLQQVLAKRDQIEAQVGQAEANNYPTVTLVDSFSPGGWQNAYYYNFSGKAISPSLSSYTIDCGTGISNGIQLQVQYPLFTGGAVTYGIKQAKSGLDILDQQVQLTKQQLQSGAYQYYYAALYAKNIVNVRKTTEEMSREHLRVVNAQYSAGVVAKSDVLRTQAELAQAQKDLISSQNDYELAVLNLKTFMNIPISTNIILTEDLSYKDKSLNASSLVDYALKNRPDYLAAQLTITKDEYAQKVSEAGYYPTIALGASFSNSLAYGTRDTIYSSYYPNQTMNSISNQAIVSANLQYNVFDGFLTRNQVKAAVAQVAQDKQAYEQSRLTVILDVNKAVNNIVTDLKLITANKAYLDFANENYKINLVQYSAGVTTNLNVMDAQNQLTQAQTAYYQALFQYNQDNAKLAQAIGEPVK